MKQSTNEELNKGEETTENIKVSVRKKVEGGFQSIVTERGLYVIRKDLFYDFFNQYINYIEVDLDEIKMKNNFTQGFPKWVFEHPLFLTFTHSEVSFFFDINYAVKRCGYLYLSVNKDEDKSHRENQEEQKEEEKKNNKEKVPTIQGIKVKIPFDTIQGIKVKIPFQGQYRIFTITAHLFSHLILKDIFKIYYGDQEMEVSIPYEEIWEFLDKVKELIKKPIRNQIWDDYFFLNYLGSSLSWHKKERKNLIISLIDHPSKAKEEKEERYAKDMISINFCGKYYVISESLWDEFPVQLDMYDNFTDKNDVEFLKVMQEKLSFGKNDKCNKKGWFRKEKKKEKQTQKTAQEDMLMVTVLRKKDWFRIKEGNAFYFIRRFLFDALIGYLELKIYSHILPNNGYEFNTKIKNLNIIYWLSILFPNLSNSELSFFRDLEEASQHDSKFIFDVDRIVRCKIEKRKDHFYSCLKEEEKKTDVFLSYKDNDEDKEIPFLFKTSFINNILIPDLSCLYTEKTREGKLAIMHSLHHSCNTYRNFDFFLILIDKFIRYGECHIRIWDGSFSQEWPIKL